MPSQKEIERRYKNVRSHMQQAGLDALLVCGNQYAGFEGAVFYMSGFEIVHRYVYVLFPLEGEPTLVFPREARWIGDKGKPWIKDHVWPEVPGQWIRDIAKERHWKKLGVYGMNFVMAVRDYRELSNGSLDLIPFDTQFDTAVSLTGGPDVVKTPALGTTLPALSSFSRTQFFYKPAGTGRVASVSTC